MKLTSIVQLVRECPPGYGGIERVAHELAIEWLRTGIEVTTICLQPAVSDRESAFFSVPYQVYSLPRLSLGQLLIPLPTRKLFSLLNGNAPLHVHLPCPTMLILCVMAKLRKPKRLVSLHWHAFLKPPSGFHGLLVKLYQWSALRWAAYSSIAVVTTSPILAAALEKEGVVSRKIQVLSCCLGKDQEQSAFAIANERRHRIESLLLEPFRVLYIGRLDSYKKVDWLIHGFSQSRASQLDIVGDGPNRQVLQTAAGSCVRSSAILFHGRLDETKKQALLRHAHLLVLPADRCNEAFGIVQIEAMACGVPTLAFDYPRSGAAWVGNIKHIIGLNYVSRAELVRVIDCLVSDRYLQMAAMDAAEQRYKLLFARSVWQARFATQLL